MYVWRIAASLFLLLAAAACDQPSRTTTGTQPVSSPGSTVRIDDVRILEVLSALPLSMRRELESRSWISDGTEESWNLARSIGTTRYFLPSENKSLTERLLERLEALPWYEDGITTDEKLVLAATFEALHLGVQLNGTLNWLELFQSTLESRLFSITKLSNSDSIITIASSHDANLARTALELSTSLIPEVEEFWGSPLYAKIFIFVDGPSTRCFVPNSSWMMSLGETCLTQSTMAHELSHLFFTHDGPTWFVEGMAGYAAGIISNKLSDMSLSVSSYIERNGGNKQIHINSVVSTGNIDEARESGSGFLFLTDVANLIGVDAMRRIGANAKGPLSGEEALNLIRSETRPERASALEDLISARVVFE